jgi:hypothetical protein
VDPVPDPLLFRKSGSAGNRTWDLRVNSQKLWLLDHRGDPAHPYLRVMVLNYLSSETT